MINQNEVLTATSVVLERIPASFKLIDQVNPLIQGLAQATVTLDGYGLKELPIKLPENTGPDTEHTALQKEAAESISTVIRQSLGIIGKMIVPACDIFESALTSCDNKNAVVDRLFGSVRLEMLYIDPALLSSPVFQIEPDAEFANGITIDLLNMDIGNWPELTAGQIRGICKDVMQYPEIAAAFDSEQDVIEGYKALSSKAWWLAGDDPTKVSVRSFNYSTRNLNSLIVLNSLLYKLSSQDGPLGDVTNITLDNYRGYINKLKRFTRTLLCKMKELLQANATYGITLQNNNISYQESTDTYSPFKGEKVLEGDVTVSYSKEMADFFSNSDTYSLSEVVVGMLLAEKTKAVIAGEGFVNRIPGYVELYTKYFENLRLAMLNNIRTTAGYAINDAVYKIVEIPEWKEFLSSQEGMNNINKFVEALNKAGGFRDMLSSPEFISSLHERRTRVANTILAVRLANVLGVPIASSILSENIDADCSTEEKQRTSLAKAIVKVILGKLIK